MKRRITITPRDTLVSSTGLYKSTFPITLEGDFEFEVEDLENYVQVKTGGYYSLTYRDPSGTLEVGDYVTVPLGRFDTPSIGEVVALGRGGYDGYTKDVSARLVSEELA